MDNKRLILEIVKSIVYAILGIFFGVLICVEISSLVRVLGLVGISCLFILTVVAFILLGRKEPDKKSISNISGNRSSRYPEKPNYAEEIQNSQMQNARMSGRQAQNNPLDRRPMSAEKKEQREKHKVAASKIVLINEEGRPLMEWSLDRKTSLIIGKSSEKEPVDVDLAGSAVAQMISKQHAVLNYTENGWYVDDIDSKNGTRVKKATQHAIMDVKLVGAIEVEVGDIIYIASTMLQLQ